MLIRYRHTLRALRVYVPRVRATTVRFDDETWRAMERKAGRNRVAGYVRDAAIAKLARDELVAENAELRERLERVERRLAVLERS